MDMHILVLCVGADTVVVSDVARAVTSAFDSVRIGIAIDEGQVQRFSATRGRVDGLAVYRTDGTSAHRVELERRVVSQLQQANPNLRVVLLVKADVAPDELDWVRQLPDRHARITTTQELRLSLERLIEESAVEA